MALFIKKNGSLQQVAIGHEISKSEQQKSVSLDLASGDQIVTPDNGQVLTQVLIKKPETLLASNIKKDVNIAGVVGTYVAQDYLPYIISDKGNYTYEDNTITELKGYAFYRDLNITSFSSSSVTKIKTSAFYNSGLISINCPNFACDTTSEAGQCASVFQNCASLTAISFPQLKVIPQSLCYYCSSLINVYLPEATTINGGGCFYYCTSLQSISLPKLEKPSQTEFYGCSQLSSVSLPKLQYTSSNMFTNCSSLTSISFTSEFVGNTSGSSHCIGQSCFEGCTNLASVSGFEYIIKGSIGSSAFKGCSSLTSINVGSPTTINGNAFQNCTSLTSIIIGNTNTITGTAFNGCTSLSNITITKSSVCALSSTTNFPTGQNIQVHVPSNLISSYQSASNWTTLYNNGDVTFVAIQ